MELGQTVCVVRAAVSLAILLLASQRHNVSAEASDVCVTWFHGRVDSCGHGHAGCNSTAGHDARLSCYCDPQCSYFADCCDDYADVCLGGNRTESSSPGGNNTSSTSLDDGYVCASVFGGNVGVWLKQSCPDTWEDDHIRDLCEKTAFNFTSFSFEVIPAASQEGLVFRNIFCAQCNGVDEADVQMWQMGWECENIYDSVMEEGIQLEEIIARANNLSKHGGCHLVVNAGDVLAEVTRYCAKYIDYCNRSLYDDYEEYVNDTRQCQLSFSLIQDKRSPTIYRNQRCANCHNLNVADHRCGLTLPKYRKKLHYPLRILLDVTTTGAVGTEVTLGPMDMVVASRQMRCSANTVFDPSQLQCVTLPYSAARKENIPSGPDLPGNTSLAKSANDSASFGLPSNHTPWLNITLRCGAQGGLLLEKLEFYIGDSVLFYDIGGAKFQTREYQILSNGSLAYVCPARSRSGSGTWQSWLTVSCATLSIVCLTVHVTMFCVDASLRTFPGRLILQLVISMLLAQTVFVAGMKLNEFRQLCLPLAVSLHYTWLSTFFWMALVSFDICRTFRSINTSLTVSQTDRRSLYYCLCGWLLPAVVVGVSVSLDFTLDRGVYDIGDGSHRVCWFHNPTALLVLFICPIALMLVFNTACYILTAIATYQCLHDSVTSRSKLGGWRRHITCCVKTFIIMGLSWLIGLFETFLDNEVLSFFVIIFNSLQGTFLFLAFVADQKIKRFLQRMKQAPEDQEK